MRLTLHLLVGLLLPVASQLRGRERELQGVTGTHNIVMYRFTDPNCTDRLPDGRWMQQSWRSVEGASYCWSITEGLLCGIGQFQGTCVIRMSCDYGSGSGVVFHAMSNTRCTGDPLDPKLPVASHLTWPEGVSFFAGACTPFLDEDGDGRPDYYLQFQGSIPVLSAGDLTMGSPAETVGGIPNCSVEGDVSSGDESAANQYVDDYDLQFYTDDNCETIFEVTAASQRTTSAFKFNVHRGAQHCYDMEDTTPRSNSTSRVADYSIMNFRFSCGNPDGVGNGLRLRMGYSGAKCTGTNRQEIAWRDQFYPMNFPLIQDLFNGRCIRWGQFSAKFNKAWDLSHYPDCENNACDRGLCAGGRVRTVAAATPRPDIRQAPSGNLARAPSTALALTLALAASLLGNLRQ